MRNPQPLSVRRAEHSTRGCPTCGSIRTSGTRFCGQCGREFTTEHAVQRSFTDVQPSSDERSTDAGAPPVSHPPSATATGRSEQVRSAPSAPTSPGATADGEFHGEPSAPAASPLTDTRLMLIHGDGPAESVALLDGADVTLGSGPDNTVPLTADPYVSRRHARISRSGGMTFVEDLGSANGTLLRIRHPIALEPDDEIVVGTSILRVEHINQS